jgi:hypothetical protein
VATAGRRKTVSRSPRPNPFEVLRLDPTASDEEVIAQAGRLRQRAADEEEVNAIRQAVQVLTGSAAERFVHQMLAHPRPCYDWPALERFRAAFRRPPPAAPGGPAPDPAEVARLLGSFLTGDLDLGPAESVGSEPAEDMARADLESQWRRLAEG